MRGEHVCLSVRIALLVGALVAVACGGRDGPKSDGGVPDTALVFIDGEVEPPDAFVDQRRSGQNDAPLAPDASRAVDGPLPIDAPVPIDAPLDHSRDFAPEMSTTPLALPNGQPCAADAACASGLCVDKVCCESRCDSSCWSCVNVQTGGPNGLCRPRVAGALCGQPSCSGNMLTVAPVCNGAGACLAQRPQACPGGAPCESATTCKTCASTADCPAAQFCDRAAAACKPSRANGETCEAALAGADCTSGHCSSDGVCCDSACTELCRSCLRSKNGQESGRCLPIRADTDPENECRRDDPSTCGLDGACDGSGRCRRYPDGSACGGGCCNRGAGGEGRPRPCLFVCRGGSCDRDEPVVTDKCVGQSCCCPNGGPGGAPACTTGQQCPAGPAMCM